MENTSKRTIISRMMCKYSNGLVFDHLGDHRYFYKLDPRIDQTSLKDQEDYLFELCEIMNGIGDHEFTGEGIAMPIVPFLKIK